jgi:hypothetical protein
MELFHCLVLLIRMILKFEKNYYDRFTIHTDIKDYLIFCVNLLLFIYADHELSKEYIKNHKIDVKTINKIQ